MHADCCEYIFRSNALDGMYIENKRTLTHPAYTHTNEKSNKNRNSSPEYFRSISIFVWLATCHKEANEKRIHQHNKLQLRAIYRVIIIYIWLKLCFRLCLCIKGINVEIGSCKQLFQIAKWWLHTNSHVHST